MRRALQSLRQGIAALACLLAVCTASAAKTLDLSGYTDASGAITVQHQGDTVDPYFALQALWLAQSQGLDISDQALPWARWLAQHYSAAGHLGRYCKTASGWTWCKAPDADDASLALWLALLRQLPAADRQALGASALEARARQDLQQLLLPEQGVYKVSPHLTHSLFMDNLEIWSTLPGQRLGEHLFEMRIAGRVAVDFVIGVGHGWLLMFDALSGHPFCDKWMSTTGRQGLSGPIAAC